MVFQEYYTSLVRFAMNYVKGHDASEEIVQDVLVNLWEKRKDIESTKLLKSYLYTSVKNRCLNYIRDNKKFRSQYLDIELELEIPVDFKDTHSEQYTQTRVEEALSRLPEKCREVFMLCRFDDMKNKEVAEKLGISIKTVEAQMSKALKILKDELKEFLIFLIILITIIFR